MTQQPDDLLNMLEQTKRGLPGLKLLTVVSRESAEAVVYIWGWGWGQTSLENAAPGPGWLPPACWRSSCESAKVSYSVYLGDDRKYREFIEGGAGFDDDFNA